MRELRGQSQGRRVYPSQLHLVTPGHRMCLPGHSGSVPIISLEQQVATESKLMPDCVLTFDQYIDEKQG